MASYLISRETPLFKVIDSICNNIDNNLITLVLLCDMSKAFDSVNHDILTDKLDIVNVDEFWFDNYLRNRRQIVKIGNVISNSTRVTHGVPQRSIIRTNFILDLRK